MLPNRIAIGIGLTNLPREVDADEIQRFIAREGDDYEIYGLAPPPPGVRRAAALDLMTILSGTGSVASMAALLWVAYDRFIASKKSSAQDDAGIYIAIRRPDGTIVDFWIGNTDRDREIFIEEFTAKVTAMREEDDPSFWNAEVAEIERSGIWVRRS